MAEVPAQILRQLGNNWLECQDEQGIFYWNQITQQSSDTLPPELMGAGPVAAPMAIAAPMAAPMAVAAPMAAPMQGAPRPTKAAKVLSGGIASLPQNATPPPSYMPPVMQQGPYQVQQQVPCSPQKITVSYSPQAVQQVQMTPQQVQQIACQQQQQQIQAQQVVMLPGAQVQASASYAPAVASYTPPVPQAQVVQAQSPLPQGAQLICHPQGAQPVQPQLAPAVQKMSFGDWAVYQDELGTFYMHVPTGQQFENPPPELAQAYQQYRAEEEMKHQQALRAIELQRIQVDQQLAQQEESLRLTYGINAGGILA